MLLRGGEDEPPPHPGPLWTQISGRVNIWELPNSASFTWDSGTQQERGGSSRKHHFLWCSLSELRAPGRVLHLQEFYFLFLFFFPYSGYYDGNGSLGLSWSSRLG